MPPTPKSEAARPGSVFCLPVAPGAVAGHGVVETDAVEIDVGILRIVTADVETHLAETIRRDAVVKVLRRRERRRQRLLVGRRRIAVELGEERIVETGRRSQRRNDHGVQVAHVLPYPHAELELFEIGCVESHAVVAGRQILEKEVAVLVGHGGETRRFERHLDVAQRFAAAARNHLAADTALLRVGHGEGRQSKQKKK